MPIARVLAVILLLAAVGCTSPPAASPESVLKEHGLTPDGAPEMFSITVPADWHVTLGDFPAGLYWEVAQRLSADSGYDLRPLKGKQVEVRRYPVSLPRDGFQYPSDAILLVQDGHVVGGWLSFSMGVIGPSLNRRSLEQITGRSFAEWAEQEGIFADAGANADLARMGPAEVLDAFLKAITAGDKVRAHAVLSADHMLNALTSNAHHVDGGRAGRLYNPGFMHLNSHAEAFRSGKLTSYRLMDPAAPLTEIAEVGNRTRVVVAAEAQIEVSEQWVGVVGRPVWFANMVKQANGWKLLYLSQVPPEPYRGD